MNPRASRTVPFVSKATGRPLAKIAAKVMAGKTLDELGVDDGEAAAHVAVKEIVFPVREVPRRGHHPRSGDALDRRGHGHRRTPSRGRSARSLLASGHRTAALGPGLHQREGRRQAGRLRRRAAPAWRSGFTIVATRGTAKALERARIPAEVLNKVAEGSPHVVDAMRSRSVVLVVNTTQGAKEVRDSYSLRRQTLLANIPYFTTMAAALAMVQTLEEGAIPRSGACRNGITGVDARALVGSPRDSKRIARR